MLEWTEKDHLDWGNFCLFWSISNEEIHSTEHMLLTEFYFLYSSLGCIIGQNRREAVGEGKHKPSSYFMVLCFSLWTRTRHTRFSRQVADPEVLSAVLRFLELVTWSGTGFQLWQEPHAQNFMRRRPNQLRPIFFSVQRTCCKLGKYSDLHTDRTTRSAQSLLCFRLPTRGIRSMLINLSHSWL